MQVPSTDHVRVELLLRALEEGVGPAVVLDRQLRIVFASPGATHLLGGSVPYGTKAPQVFCGRAERRPIAEALARGEPAQAEIARMSSSGERLLLVRTSPVFDAGTLVGHVLYLRDRGEARVAVTQNHGILTKSPLMLQLLRMVEKVARADASVLVRGESGSGKELVAKALHALSPRHTRPFVAINCAALSEQLLESELFGHQRGAFTGAIRDTEGTFRRAHGGTLFLDEVAELPLAVQAKLLRVLQERQVLPVGSTIPIEVDVRIVSATHRSLRAEVEAGRFRADLMYRLRVIPLYLPALRQRPEDIEPLAFRFLDRLNARGPRTVETIAPAALRALAAHGWPGNVRELQNVVEFAYLMGEGPVLLEADLPDETRNATDDVSHSAQQANLTGEAARIARALERSAGNRQRAADSLGISRSTLWRRMKEYGLDLDGD